MKKLLLLVLTLLLATPVFATVIFETGNNPQPDEQNILFGSDQTGSLVTGFTNQSNTLVDFSSTTDTLVVTASGQANVTASDGLINDITISLPGGGTYMDMILNPSGTPSAADSATVTAMTSTGETFTFTYDLGVGQNFLTMFTTDGEVITSTNITSAAGFQQLRQPRISGVAGGEGGGPTIPEPTALTLLGTGLAVFGLAALRRKKQ